MIALNDITLTRGGRILLEHASVTLTKGSRIGIIGNNGCGKSSLLEAIRGHTPPDQGTITLPQKLSIAYVRQSMAAAHQAALAYVMEGDRRITQLQECRRQALMRGDGLQAAALDDQLGIAGAWELRARAGSVLMGLGLSEDDFTRSLDEFSGGWRMRLSLARALVANADLLLLDEPTNHLDLDAILFTADLLSAYPGTVLCISHDRSFLDSFVTHILHFAERQLTLYPGSCDKFEQLYCQRLQLAAQQRRQQERRLLRMRTFIERFRAKATKARQAQSMLKAMERLTLTPLPPPPHALDWVFFKPEHLPRLAVQARDLECGYSEGPGVLQHVNFTIAAGDRIGLLGANGQGKSTLIKTLCRIIAPRSGSLVWGKDLRIGYFAQHELEILRPSEHALWHISRLSPAAPLRELRTFLGSFGFSGELALSRVAALSGGERARLALALLIWQRPNLLLLDEPTNHLDFQTRQALCEALTQYEGALVVAAHDQHLLELTCSRLVLLEQHSLQEFDGNLDDYRSYILKQRRQVRRGTSPASSPAAHARTSAAPERRAQRQAEAQFRQSLRPLKLELEQLEQQLEAAQSKLSQLDAALSAPAAQPGMQELLIARAQSAQVHEQLEERYLQKLQELEDRQKEYRLAKL